MDMVAMRIGQVVGYVPVEHPLQVVDESVRQWYVLTVEPNHDQRAATYLRAHGFKVYAPTIPIVVTRGLRRAKVRIERPMFPGYLPLRVNFDLELQGRRRQRLNMAPGVRGFLAVGERAAIITDAEMRMIANIEQEERRPKPKAARLGFKAGETVRVSEGPFCGFTGEISRLDDDERITVLLGLFGGKALVTIPVSQIDKL